MSEHLRTTNGAKGAAGVRRAFRAPRDTFVPGPETERVP